MNEFDFMWKLCFIVPCLREHAIGYLSWDRGPLELAEDNHFLRFMEQGMRMRAIEIDDAKVSVDCLADLEEVRTYMTQDEIRLNYCQLDVNA